MAQPMDRKLALEAVRVTEAAAIAASHQVGRGDERVPQGANASAYEFGLRQFLATALDQCRMAKRDR